MKKRSPYYSHVDKGPFADLPSAPPWSSQVGQDRLVATLLGSDHHPRFFIDLASNHPTFISNTRALESLGYRGLCVEPNPAYHPLYAREGRNCTLVPYAVSSTRGTVPFTFRNRQEKPLQSMALGGIVGPGLDNARVPMNETVQIEAVTFAEILRNHSVPRTISYLSLDVEGAEYLVMSSFPWHRHVISLMTVERPKPELVGTFHKHDYRYVCTSGPFGDELWAHSSTRFAVTNLAHWPPIRCSAGRTLACESLIDPRSYACRYLSRAQSRSQYAQANAQAP